MFSEQDIRRELNRLDGISGLDTSTIPIQISKRMTATLAKCRYLQKGKQMSVETFVFAKRLLQHATLEHLLNTIRHEYAHAYTILTHQQADHGALWKATAKAFGCDGSRLSSYPELMDHPEGIKYELRCTACGRTARYRRRGKVVQAFVSKPTRRDYRCACGNNQFILHETDNEQRR